MATGLRLTSDGKVVVDFGRRKIPISLAEYRANGYAPSLKKLMDKPALTESLRPTREAGQPLKTAGRRS